MTLRERVQRWFGFEPREYSVIGPAPYSAFFATEEEMRIHAIYASQKFPNVPLRLCRGDETIATATFTPEQ